MSLSANMNMEKSTKVGIKFLARTGYASRALVYFIIGYFAILALFQQGGQTLGSKEALSKLLYQPFGTVLLALTGVGLICYSCWRLTQGVQDTDNHGTSLKGIAVRSGLLFSAIAHSSLALRAFQLCFSQEPSQSGGWMGWILRLPGGAILVSLIALSLFAVGIAHMVKGYQEGFLKYFKQKPSNYLKNICKIGLIAKGIVFLVIGYLTAVIAWNGSSGEKQGVKVALDYISQQSFGGFLLGTMGIGLFAFGVYSAVECVHRRIEMN